jgi:hypothetical protein
MVERMASNYLKALRLAKQLQEAEKEAKRKADEEAKKAREEEKKGV